MLTLKSVKTFLEILKSTLTLGFWKTINDMKKIVPYMLKIIAFDFEYAEKYASLDSTKESITSVSEEDYFKKVFKKVKQELKLNKPNIVLLVECKILAAKILNIIIDYEFNIRVSKITNHFKDVQQQEIDLEPYPYNEWKFKEKWKNDR